MKLLVRFSVNPRPVSAAWLQRLSTLVLKGARGAAFEKRCELSVVLTGDGEVRRLNRRYRGKDRTTDVLSFPLLEGTGPRRSGRGPVALGDVVVSVPQARRQSGPQRGGLRGELALLLIHGILHLLGYDHATKAQEKRMFGLQGKLLESFKGL